jgi:hypothetical protein
VYPVRYELNVYVLSDLSPLEWRAVYQWKIFPFSYSLPLYWREINLQEKDSQNLVSEGGEF